MGRLLEDPTGATDQRRAFRERLLARMAELNMRSADLARKADISKDSVSSYVTMRSLPSPENLSKIAKALRCKASDLLSNHRPKEIVMELRDSPLPGYTVLIARVPLPVAIAADIFAQLVKHSAEAQEAEEE